MCVCVGGEKEEGGLALSKKNGKLVPRAAGARVNTSPTVSVAGRKITDT